MPFSLLGIPYFYISTCRYLNYTPKQAYDALTGSLILREFPNSLFTPSYLIQGFPFSIWMSLYRIPHSLSPFRTLGYDFIQPLIKIRASTMKHSWLYKQKRCVYLTICKFKNMALSYCIGYITSWLKTMRRVYIGISKWFHHHLKAEQTEQTLGFITILFGELRRSLMRTPCKATPSVI